MTTLINITFAYPCAILLLSRHKIDAANGQHGCQPNPLLLSHPLVKCNKNFLSRVCASTLRAPTNTNKWGIFFFATCVMTFCFCRAQKMMTNQLLRRVIKKSLNYCYLMVYRFFLLTFRLLSLSLFLVLLECIPLVLSRFPTLVFMCHCRYHTTTTTTFYPLYHVGFIIIIWIHQHGTGSTVVSVSEKASMCEWLSERMVVIFANASRNFQYKVLQEFSVAFDRWASYHTNDLWELRLDINQI